jgi:hypothetical protein
MTGSLVSNPKTNAQATGLIVFATKMAPKTGVFSTSTLFQSGPAARGDGV